MNQKARGFTIVELLIVIVVIGILAALSYVGYANISQRANNAAIVSAVNQISKAIQAYAAQEGLYPETAEANACITTASSCVFNNGAAQSASSTLSNNLSQVVDSLPLSVPISGSGSGITYSYRATRTYNGESRPVLLAYWLYGSNQKCGITGVMSSWGGTVDPPAVTSSTGYTSGNNPAGRTMCFVSIP